MNKKKDYCTFVFDKIGNYDLSGCCAVHDEDYDNPDVSRKDADVWMKQCIEKQSTPTIAKIYYAGVRAFGWFFRWRALRKSKKL